MNSFLRGFKNGVIKWMMKHTPDSVLIQAARLHCDSCGWTRDIREFLGDNAFNADSINSLIGMKCPECGSVVINKQDADILIAMLARFEHSDATALNGITIKSDINTRDI